MRDSFGREISYMRISVTDRCNLRCRYCMPDKIALAPRQNILSFEEIERVCRAAAGLGITRLKLTGGEPLVRPGIARLVGRLRQIPGVEQVTMTTNGVLLCESWDALSAAGLDAVNISLDTTDRALYERITGFDKLPQVLAGIARASDSAAAVRINAVLQSGVNDGAWQELIRFAEDRNIDVRFIELMPIGEGAGASGVSNTVLFAKIKRQYPSIKPDVRAHGNGPAVYYRIDGFAGAVGFISAMHGKFCSSCNRIRMTASGELKPCLCYADSVSVRELLRTGNREGGDADERIADLLRRAIADKRKMHCFEERPHVTETRNMAQIGG